MQHEPMTDEDYIRNLYYAVAALKPRDSTKTPDYLPLLRLCQQLQFDLGMVVGWWQAAKKRAEGGK